jgi:hypothetical protein
MKLTRRRLRGIIKEILNETYEASPKQSGGKDKDQAYDLIEALSPMSADSVREIVFYAISAASEGDPNRATKAYKAVVDHLSINVDDTDDDDDKDSDDSETLDLRGKTVTSQSIAALKKRVRQHTGEEPVDFGTVDTNTGKVRIK